MLGFDTHAHIHYFHPGIEKHIKKAEENNIGYFCNIFPDGLGEYRQFRTNFSKMENVVFAVGFHPKYIKNINKDEILKIAESVKKDNKIRAIGEIGLDFTYKDVSQEKQYNAFNSQLILLKDVIEEFNLPVIIHGRGVEKECIKVLLKNGYKDHPVIFHCYTGSVENANKILENNWYISFSGKVTHKNKSIDTNKIIKEVWKQEKLLIETDCPYITPDGFKGKCEPFMITKTAQVISNVLNISVDTLFEKTTESSLNLFKFL